MLKAEIYYWQDIQKRGVDFVVKKRQKIEQLIQVCWNINEYRTREIKYKIYTFASTGAQLSGANFF